MRRILSTAIAVAALYAVAQAVVSTRAFEERLRTRIASVLGEHLDGASAPSVRVDWAFRASFGPLALRAGAGGPAVRIERARARPSALAILRGRLEPAAVELSGVTVPGPLAVGPCDVELTFDGAGPERRVDAAVRLAEGGRIAVRAGGDGGRWRVKIAAVDFVIAGARVGPTPIGPLRAFASLTAAWDPAERRLAVDDGAAVLLGAATVGFSGEVRARPGLPFSISFRAPHVDYRELVSALPLGLAPPPDAPRPPGALAARLEVAGSLEVPASWALDAALDLSRMREAARRSPSPLREAFVHRPDPADPARVIVVGPASADFVPIAELPEHVVRAVTTSEDAGFFAHQGFDFDELRNALAEGAEAGRVVRGGSTITQQVAKNLFLSPDRTLARKVREAVVAIGLEASLPKRRLLEIYLNVAEWGPGMWGIGPAARHWFGKDARALTPKEAAFLASIIPSPLRYHAMFAKGAAPEAWEARVNGLLVRMAELGALSDDQLVEGLEAPLRFAGG